MYIYPLKIKNIVLYCIITNEISFKANQLTVWKYSAVEPRLRVKQEWMYIVLAGLSESFEVDSWVFKVSGRSRDILF